MKRKLHFKLFILLFLITSLVSAQFSVGNLTYNVTDGTNVSVKTTNTSISGDLAIPTKVSNSGTTYTVTSIGDFAFNGCSDLTSITIPDAVTSIGDYAFPGCSGLTSITIPDAVTSIGDYAFVNCSGLTSVTIPDAVTSIGDYAFAICSGLTSITISDAVTRIGDYVFSGCSGLTSVNIPDAVTSIGDYAFYFCSGLTAVNVSWATPLGINSNVFYGLNLNTIALNVADPGSSSDYETAAVWKDFASINTTLGTNNYQVNSSVKLYPNPAKNYISILGLLEKENYIIYNASGTKVNAGSVSSNEKIDTQNLANGTYFIKLNQGYAIKFIK